MCQAIWEGLQTGVLEEISEAEARFVMAAFCVPKPGGKVRLVLDCRPINLYIAERPFKMESLADLARLMARGMFATTLDLTSAFHHVPVEPGLRVFLNFRYDGHYYRYCGLPFGLRSAPRIFSKALRACVCAMREAWDVHIFQYMDDLILLSSSSERLREITGKAVRFLRWLGWTVNLTKSKMEPTQTPTFLGMEWDTTQMTVRSIPEKNKRLKRENKQWIRKARNGDRVIVRALARLTGRLSATRIQHCQAPLYLTTLYRLISVTTRSVGWSGNVTLSRQLLPQLHWWRRQLHANKPRLFQMHRPTVTMETDASDTGWGATLQRTAGQMRMAYGWWKGAMLAKGNGGAMTSKGHELRTVEKALRFGMATGEIRRGDDVWLRSDSTTVVFNVN
jgi:hypothetical protein